MSAKKNKYYLLLLSIFFFHLISIVICAFQDITRELEKRPDNYFASKTNVSYWFWFFAWWSAWTSLLTFFWVIYRLIKKNNNSYWTQFFDLNVLVSNVISGVIFTAGWILNIITGGKVKLLTNIPREGLASLKEIKVNFSIFKLSAYHCWIIYNLAWHVIAPCLMIYFFWKFSATDLLKKKIKSTLFASLLNPTIWLFYVFLRPIVDYQNNYQFTKTEPYHYPHDYPFSFFNRCVGKPTWKGDTYKSTWLKQIFWIILVFGITYLIYYLLTYYSIKLKKNSAKVEKLA